jgi:hypothetical protein
MCDLSNGERNAILGLLGGLEGLVTQIRSSARSIEERNWMDHEALDVLLDHLATKAAETRGWVHQKMAAMEG